MKNLAYKLFAIIAISLISNVSLAKEDEIYTSFFSSTGAGGYDVVAYFTEGKPVEGNGKYVTEYKNAEWQFASQENLEKFKQDPETYAPQYGGYCAWAVSQGSLASGDPLQWSIVNDRLYLNYDAKIQARWSADRDNFIVQGNKNWPNVLD